MLIHGGFIVYVWLMFNYFKKAATAAITKENQPIFPLHLKHVGKERSSLSIFLYPFVYFRFSYKENFLWEKV